MIVLRGIGGHQGSRTFRSSDLMFPGQLREIGEQWLFGRSVREDLEAAADELAGQGIRHIAAQRQAVLERLFSEFVSGTHAAGLDDAQVVALEDVLIDDPECQALHAILREKIERLRTDPATLAIFEDEMRNLGRLAIEQALSLPVLQWRAALAAKFLASALEARDFALSDTLRDVPNPVEGAPCKSLIDLSRLQIAQERFQ